MWRTLFTVLLVLSMVAFSTRPRAYGQYAPGSYSGPGNAPQYPQVYPQNQPYNPAGQYPQLSQSQDVSQGQDAAMDEQHGVARLSVVQGDVNVKRGDNGELVAAVINAPLMKQDHLQTSPGSRAEVELDSGNLIRLAPNTDIGFADLEYHRYQLQLAAGAIVFRVFRPTNAQAEVDTPSIAFRPEGQGEYRIAVLDDGATQISVRSGQAEIFGPRGSERLLAGRSILVRGNPADPEFQPVNEGPHDQFDDWSLNRDRELLGSQSYRYVSPDISGAEDLDASGNWVPSQYGQVWEPSGTAPDWSPYSDGQWSWQPYYGWTWVDAAPWGWAPYHYGRWFWNAGHRWCWWPGEVGPRYLWNPALVGFFGVGGGVGYGFGGLGWVALAPFEAFHPWWRNGWGRGGYGRGEYGRGDFGTVRGANLAGMYRNAAIRGGAMTASLGAFGGYHQHFSPATRNELSGVSVFRGQIPVSPARSSYQFSQRAANVNPRLTGTANRQFFSRQANTGATGWTRFNQANVGRAPQYSSPARPSSASGWQRFGDPSRSTGTTQGFTGGQEASGWHHFGEARQATPSYAQPRSAYVAPHYQVPQRQNFPSYGGSYNGGNRSYSAPRQSAPPAQHYSAPSPSYRGNGGGGGGSHGGEHSSSGGHRGR